jgi:hypothetical protein
MGQGIRLTILLSAEGTGAVQGHAANAGVAGNLAIVRHRGGRGGLVLELARGLG